VSALVIGAEPTAPAVELADALCAHAGVPPARLRLAETLARRRGVSLVAALRQLRIVTDEALARTLAALYRWPCLGAETVRPEAVDRGELERLGVDWALRHQVVVLRTPRMAVVADPTQTAVTDRVAQLVGALPLLAVAPRRILVGCLMQAFPSTPAHLARAVEALEREGLQPGAIAAWVSHVIGRAVVLRASDIHLEPEIELTHVRYRVDGVLRLEEIPLPGTWHPNLINVIQVLAGLKHGGLYAIKEGRLIWDLPGGDTIEIRVVLAPILNGAGDVQMQAVLRLLDRHRSALSLDELGYPPRQQAAIEDLTRSSDGLVLFVGPVNSGKSTSLYAILAGVASPERKVVTIEDPIETLLGPLVQQHQVNHEAGLTYAAATRAFLREDVDVMLVGEIRDRETAREIVQAAMTGRLAFSTMHAGGAVQAIPRLLTLGVEAPYLASTLRGVVAQRLLRRLCPVCREPVLFRDLAARVPSLARHYGGVLPSETPLWAAPGCPACAGTGGFDRVVVAEILPMSPAIAGAIEQQRSVEAIRALAGERGFQPIGAQAMALVRDGVVGLLDADRVLGPAVLLEGMAAR
jgi:type II secretory ATPase GspE/PulE/Tfp pilus assembly ATPase PilB-like protein